MLSCLSVGRVEVSYSVLGCVSVLPKAKGFGGTWLHYQGRRSQVRVCLHLNSTGLADVPGSHLRRTWRVRKTAVIELTVLITLNLSKTISEPKGILVDVISNRRSRQTRRASRPPVDRKMGITLKPLSFS